MRYKHVLVAINAFKDNISTLQAGNSFAEGLYSVSSELSTTIIPVSDGGDGLLDVVRYLYDCEERLFDTCNALGEPVQASVLFCDQGRRAFIEMASCNSLALCSRVDFPNTSSFGVGLLIKQAVEHGARDIVLGVGGSACSDMGLGLLQALGLKVQDLKGEEMQVKTGTLGTIAAVAFSPTKGLPSLDGVSITCWVDGEAYVDGDDGCWARTINKGGTAEDEQSLKGAVLRLVPMIERLSGKKISKQNLLGCGGAVASGLYAFANARIALGADEILEALGADELIRGCDLVVTGEGRVDHTTFLNKLPGRLIERARVCNKPVILVTAKSTLPYDELRQRGVMSTLRTELNDYDVSYVRSHTLGEKFLRQCGENLGLLIT